MRLSVVNNYLVVWRWCTAKMNDSTLIRLENLRALCKTPAELTTLVGNSKQYWSDMLRGRKSFGETAARKIEEKLELPRGFLDQPDGEMSRDVTAGSSMIADGVEVADTGENPSQSIPTSMLYEPRHLKSAILLMGSLLGALDRRSKRIVGDLLKELAEDTDDAADIAEKASVLATVQKPISKNKALNKAIQGRGDPVETGPAPLEKYK